MFEHIKTQKFWLSLIKNGIFLLILFLVISLYQARNIPANMPVLKSQYMTGEPVKIEEMIKQAPVIIYFWGSWCPMCRFTSSTISDLSQTYPVITIALSSGDKQEVVDYLKEKNYTFPVINDADGQISQMWKVMVTPTILIINTKGEISSAMVGITSAWGIKARYWFDSLF